MFLVVLCFLVFREKGSCGVLRVLGFYGVDVFMGFRVGGCFGRRLLIPFGVHGSRVFCVFGARVGFYCVFFGFVVTHEFDVL